jgi:biotin carboxyl carrier protein
MTTKSRSKTISIDGTKYKTNLNKKFENREKWKKPNENIIKAFIPGTILKVYVKKGDVLKIGDKLLVLEAMKMRNQITVPVSGKVKKINVAEGDVIPKGHLLVEIE